MCMVLIHEALTRQVYIIRVDRRSVVERLPAQSTLPNEDYLSNLSPLIPGGIFPHKDSFKNKFVSIEFSDEKLFLFEFFSKEF